MSYGEWRAAEPRKVNFFDGGGEKRKPRAEQDWVAQAF